MALRIERIMAMDPAIRSGRYPTIKTFVEQFEVGGRAVRYDLAFMRDRLNAPLAYDRGRGGYYYTDPHWVLPAIFATEGELLAFFLSAELARRYLGTTFEQPLRDAIKKIAASLPNKIQLDLNALTQHFSFQPGAIAAVDPLLLVALQEAMDECWPVGITYFTASRGEHTKRVIEPYHLHNVRGEWQVIAFDRLRSKILNFAVSRIERWSVRKHERFERQPDFSPEAYLAHGFVAERDDTPIEVIMHFDEYQARYIRERQWHPSQQIEEHDDGSLTLTLQTGALNEVRRWVMSYGSHACVLAPEHLRAEIAAEVASMCRHYLDEAETKR